jgi:hypothetical protein
MSAYRSIYIADLRTLKASLTLLTRAKPAGVIRRHVV